MVLDAERPRRWRGPRLHDRPGRGETGAGPQAGTGRGRAGPGHRRLRAGREHPRTTPRVSPCWTRSPSTPAAPSRRHRSTRASRTRSPRTAPAWASTSRPSHATRRTKVRPPAKAVEGRADLRTPDTAPAHGPRLRAPPLFLGLPRPLGDAPCHGPPPHRREHSHLARPADGEPTWSGPAGRHYSNSSTTTCSRSIPAFASTPSAPSSAAGRRRAGR